MTRQDVIVANTVCAHQLQQLVVEFLSAEPAHNHCIVGTRCTVGVLWLYLHVPAVLPPGSTHRPSQHARSPSSAVV